MSHTIKCLCACGERFTLFVAKVKKGVLYFYDCPECPVCFGDDWKEAVR